MISKLKELYCQPQGSSVLSSRLSFLITSRPYTEIEREFEGFSTTEYLHFDGDKKSPAINREIDLVIDEHVRQIAGNFTKGDQPEISKRLKGMENRTYLWLYVIFETIKEDPSRHGKRSSIERLLNNIPSRLSEAYEIILSRSKCQEETERLLGIILAAARPLTLDEANVALTLAFAEEDFVSHAALVNDLWPRDNFESMIKGLSGLFISAHDSKLFLIHQTAREFLIGPSGRGMWEGRLSMSKSSSTISRTCIRFLMLPDLDTFLKGGDLSGDDDTNSFIFNNLPPFFRYAATHWASHFLSQEAIVIEQSLKDARTLCDARQAWVHAAEYNGRLSGFQDMTDLSLASYLGLKQVIENILSEEHVDVNIEGKFSESALSAACLAGRSDVVTLLLNKGANCNAPLAHGTALHTALLFHHHDIVSILLENGADPNIRSGEKHGDFAIHEASFYGFQDIVELLLKYGADVNLQGARKATALQVASWEGHREIVALLLDHGADITMRGEQVFRDWDGHHYTHTGTALDAATERGHTEIMEMLAKAEAKVRSRTRINNPYSN